MKQSHLPLTLAMLLGCISAAPAWAYRYEPHRTKEESQPQQLTERSAANCAPATGLYDLEWNNVRALVETGGSMWQNRSSSEARYEIPKEGGVSSMYAGALWIGGRQVGSNQIKLAAHDFRVGNDFWTGPLTAGPAEVDENTCNEYDRFWVTTRQDAALHRAYFDCLNDPECNAAEEYPGYIVPPSFQDWPAHGSMGQDYFLAPFYDYAPPGQEPDGIYNPNQGDYPAYDLFRELPCGTRTRETEVPLYGDFNMWWVFNDKGNIHTETGGVPIGMEVRAQAFAFASNDEINNMTFYNYVLINQGTTELKDAYFAQWADPDIGNANDDYVGCDVQRGLGYAYNGDAFDEPGGGSLGYGANPPAVGIDFFEGPFQDADNEANPLTDDYVEALTDHGIPYPGLGIGYGDSIVDNERFGMRKFLYYNNGQDPQDHTEYYGLMQGIWPNGFCMSWGEDGFDPDGESSCTDFMFPGDSDPIGWGTNGVPQPTWSEASENNPPGDRRFLQSAGPFRLEPGARNNITVGVVWARGQSGDVNETLAALRVADDKAQSLFDNCFRILEGPDAPDVEVVELENQLVLNLSNSHPLSTNFQEGYAELDAQIPGELADGTLLTPEEREYHFQGYQVWQLAGPEVSAADLDNPDLARLIITTDKRDGIDQIVNHTLDPSIGFSVPQEMANGPNDGVRHSFHITNDAFASGDPALVNHRTYFFMVLAYAHNEYEPYNTEARTGQFKPYISSRKSATGPLRVISGIPHKPEPAAGGQSLQSVYDQRIPITQLEGSGNALLDLRLTPETEADILSGAPWRTEPLRYTGEGSPIEVRVIDPKAVEGRDFVLLTNPDNLPWEEEIHWELRDAETDELLHISQHPIQEDIEEMLPEFGLSVRIPEHAYSDDYGHFTELISASISYEDPAKPWWLGIPDSETLSEQNWIRSGTQTAPEEATGAEAVVHDMWPPPVGATNGIPFNDPDEDYENILGGTWAPWCVTSYSALLDDGSYFSIAPRTEALASTQNVLLAPRIRDLNNVNIVLTADRELWTRCPVLEMQANPGLSVGNVGKMELRDHPSVDKYGRTVAQGAASEEATLGGTQPNGMGWFPGYAIDVSTGERLNMAFGEDSFLTAQRGNDMVWNPTSAATNNAGTFNGAGQHWIYVFRNGRRENNGDADWIPGYDAGQFMHDILVENSTLGRYRVWKSCSWVGSGAESTAFPMHRLEDGLIPQETTIRLRVAKPYGTNRPDGGDAGDLNGSENHWNPRYFFSTRGLEVQTGQAEVLEDALACINVVPNPYYGFSEYEANKLDNRVKITNLPEVCTVSIFSVNGTLVRQFQKSDPLTSLDWDLKNHRNVPVASGVYLIHVAVPGIGERVLKWFGVIRPADLDNF